MAESQQLLIRIAADTRGLTGTLVEAERASVAASQRIGSALSATDRALGSSGAVFRSYRGAIQQAGFQIGDFAVQLAGGVNPIVAFTQQGSQLLQILGPIGAVLGAVVSIAGAVAIGMLGMSRDTKTAADAATEFNDAFAKTNELLLTAKERQSASLAREVGQAIGGNVAAYRALNAELDKLEGRRSALERGIGDGRGLPARELAEARAELAGVEELMTQKRRQMAELDAASAQLGNPAGLGASREAAAKTAEKAAADRQRADEADLQRAVQLEQLDRRLAEARAAAAAAEMASRQDIRDFELAALDDSLKKTRALHSEMARFADQVFDRVGAAVTQMFVQGEGAAVSWKGVMRGVLSEIHQEFMRLAIMNPLKNMLFGGNAPTLAGMGGLIGSVGLAGLGDFFSGASASMFGTTFGTSSMALYNQNLGLAAAGAPGAAFADGGSFTVGGSGGTDSRRVSFKATPGEKVTVETPGQQRGGGGNTYIIDARGADMGAVARVERALHALAGPGVVERRAVNATADAAKRGGRFKNLMSGR
jgi:hypothetical protein